MSGSANVNSIDAVARLAAALDRYKEETLVALDQLQMEIRRAIEWIGHERKDFWDREVRLGWQRVTEARTELQRRMTNQAVKDHKPACREEKLALEKAKRRLHVAEQKVELVRRWGRPWNTS